MGCQCLTVGKDMYHLHIREGLVELFNRLFRYPTMKSVVQVLSKSGDTSIDRTKVRGVEVSLRSLEFKGIQDIDETLGELDRNGVDFNPSFSEFRCHLG